ncbi:MAG: hypothetical protein JWO36_3527 [Myxococcales bacterium]|nr:hypothetical protein [Myxococcales bacterium]
MVRIRTGWLVVVAGLALGVSGCKKNDEKKSDQPTTGDKTTESKSGADNSQAVSAAVSAVAGNADDLSLLPVDSEMVLGLNFAQLQQSALWKQYSPKIMDKMASGLAEFKAACGFDPMEAVKSVSLGMKELDKKPNGAIVVHGPEKAKVMACLDKAKAEAVKKGTEITIDGNVFLVKDKAGETSAFTFVNDTTLLGTMGSAGTKDGVLAAAKGTSALKTSQTFVEMYSKINTKESLWMLMNGNSPMFSKMGAMGVKPKAIFGSINLTDGLTVDMRMRLATPDEATSFVNMIKPQITNPQVKQMVDKLDVGTDGTDVKFSLGMSSQKLQSLVGMLGGMMGGMMGGMGGGMGGP